MIHYGHTHPDHAQDPSQWENLEDHLADVARRASRFANKFGCADFGDKLGWWHDLGKFSEAFQRYLAASGGDTEEADDAKKPGRGPDHSTAGAQHAATVAPGIGHLLAYAIAGHHAGLPDGMSGNPGVAQESSLEYRLKHSAIKPWELNARATLPHEALQAPVLDKPHARFLADGYATSFWIRMIFSCLVDADFLATEAFMNAKQSAVRHEHTPPSIEALTSRLSGYMAAKQATAPATRVNMIRADILDACLKKAPESPGMFSLTVPTGGGKTLASLSFALEHARRHGLERVVYVIPFTSIIEQNAAVFRDALGDDAVLEHHSNFDGEPDDNASPDARRRAWQNKLAAENWDAPVIVTTGVQFFESLHAHKPSRCRKLHNLAKAVVILDEAQTLPVSLLQPCLRALEQLTKNYGSTVVLCTATQPAVNARKNFPCGITGVREIIPQKLNLHDSLRRVIIERIRDEITDEDLAAHLLGERQALCIVNTRWHAQELFKKLRGAAGESCESAQTSVFNRTIFHLSAQMCPAHRAEILGEVRRRLAAGEICRLVSTQLIEAGVDVDFPCVYRSMAGLDAIAQAAGRCNREGRLTIPGRVFIFKSKEHVPPAGFLKQTADTCAEVIDLPDFAGDATSPAALEKYFRLLYWRNFSADSAKDRTNFVKLAEGASNKIAIVGGLIPKNFDDEDIEGDFTFALRTLGENFRLIEKTSASVLVPYGDTGRGLTEALRAEILRAAYAPAERMKLLRKLQRYTVSIPKSVFAKAVSDGRIQKVNDSVAVLVSPELAYSPDFGVSLGDRDGETGLLSV